ncbi:hypothetical protein ABZ234_08070 [Nocardiopsis sp. NPDC006198]|uniref:hypothetical protein n=1 Tax=Nocardiopsis sp. NPDC006198 TaxID=3154472 RepID=UPI0033B6FAF8
MTFPVHIRPITYWVSAVPETVVDAHHFGLTVRYRGNNTWCVKNTFDLYLDANGEAEVEHRLSFEEAMERATGLVPHTVVNGYTVADALAFPDGPPPRT